MTDYVLHDTKHLRHATADYQSISNTRDKNTFVTRTNSEFASWPVPHKSTNTIWSTSRLANSEFVLVVNLLLSHV